MLTLIEVQIITECILGKGIALGGDIDDCLVYFKNHDVGRRDT